MFNLNLEFQEEYKRLDRLCKDYLSSSEGVSEYISRMESTPWSERRYASTWDNDYRNLKHVRWIRNQLAHEVGTLNSDICADEDIDWVKLFYDRIINGNDPFTEIAKAKKAEAQRRKQLSKAIESKPTESAPSTPPSPTTTKPKTKKTSFWKKLISKILK